MDEELIISDWKVLERKKLESFGKKEMKIVTFGGTPSNVNGNFRG